MLSTDTALFLGLTWFFFIAAWCAVTYIVRALTWLDDGDGTLFPGVFSTLTDSNADWKRYWMLDGVLIRIFTPWYRHHEYAEYDNETKYEGPPLPRIDCDRRDWRSIHIRSGTHRLVRTACRSCYRVSLRRPLRRPSTQADEGVGSSTPTNKWSG